MIRIAPQRASVYCGCKTESSGRDFQLFLLLYPGLEKSSTLDRNIFWPYCREMIRIAHQRVLVCCGCKTESSGHDFQLFLLLYLGLEQSSKFDWNIFQMYWLKTIWTAPKTMWVCFECKTESSRTGFQHYLL